MPLLDVIDEHFVRASPALVREATCRETTWKRWFPDLDLVCFDERGLLGKRWRVTGRLTGTAEVWLEESGDGVIVHVFVQAGPSRPSRWVQRDVRRLRRRYARPLKRWLFTVKDDLESPVRVA